VGILSTLLASASLADILKKIKNKIKKIKGKAGKREKKV
jgi:hypothetical protein